MKPVDVAVEHGFAAFPISMLRAVVLHPLCRDADVYERIWLPKSIAFLSPRHRPPALRFAARDAACS